MKAVILAGGYGTRISEESSIRPKPMVEIGEKPILWHIMKIYAAHGITDFVICCGYKGHMIKEYFANYYLHASDVTFDLKQNSMQIHDTSVEPWTVTLIDTPADGSPPIIADALGGLRPIFSPLSTPADTSCSAMKPRSPLWAR